MSNVPNARPPVKYEQWLAVKRVTDAAVGIDDAPLGPHLFPYQRDLVSWALRRGRAAMFARHMRPCGSADYSDDRRPFYLIGSRKISG